MDREKPKKGMLYKHFKGQIYEVDMTAMDTESGEVMVVYHKHGSANSSFSISYWVRPLEMFMSEVDHEKYPDVTQKYRFEQI